MPCACSSMLSVEAMAWRSSRPWPRLPATACRSGRASAALASASPAPAMTATASCCPIGSTPFRSVSSIAGSISGSPPGRRWPARRLLRPWTIRSATISCASRTRCAPRASCSPAIRGSASIGIGWPAPPAHSAPSAGCRPPKRPWSRRSGRFWAMRRLRAPGLRPSPRSPRAVPGARARARRSARSGPRRATGRTFRCRSGARSRLYRRASARPPVARARSEAAAVAARRTSGCAGPGGASRIRPSARAVW